MSAAALEVRDLSVAYGPIQIVHRASFTVPTGQVTCLIGTNGAGKTTTIRALVGLHRPTGGQVRLQGREITGLPAHRMAALGIAIVPEGRRVFRSLSVLDNLRIGGVRTSRRWRAPDRVDDVFTLFPELADLQDRPAGLLSGGQQQMLAIGRALMSAPEVLVLDEPSMGLAPVLVTRIYEALVELKARGTSILLAEQNARLALALSDVAYVLETGTIVDHGPADALRQSERVQHIYLGGHS